VTLIAFVNADNSRPLREAELFKNQIEVGHENVVDRAR